MKASVKRKYSAWLLLLVFVPMMVLTSLHVHDYEETAVNQCEQCAHHIRHAGHLNAISNHSFDCPFCQFASLPYVAPIAAAVAVAFIVINKVYINNVYRVCAGVCDLKSTRAPPFLF